MNPNQPPTNQPPTSYQPPAGNQPPTGNQPPAGYPSNPGAPTSMPPLGQPPAGAPQPQPQQFAAAAPPNQPPQPASPTAADWYRPPTPKDNGPAKANDYVSQFKQPQDPTGFDGASSESYSIDYLNKLAGTTPATKTVAPANQKKILIGVGIFLALSLSAVLLVLANQKGPTNTSTERVLYTTIFNNSEIADEASKEIKSSQLSSLNSAYYGQLVNDMTAMSAPLAKRGIDAKELGKAAKKAAAFQETLQKLEDARLNAIYDQTYATELNYQLQSIIMLMEKIEKLSSNKAMVDFVKKGKPNYITIQDGLEDYNSNLAPGN